MINNNPIGLFDSGVGGTSIWSAIHDLLPNENTIYLADSHNAPYGLKSKQEITALCEKNIELLLELNCKIIVIACNTATTNSIATLRAKYQVPFIGIEPAIKPAANNSKTQTIGILATAGTLNSELFNKNVEQFHETKIIEQIGHELVNLIESGNINSDKTFELLKIYLNPMIEQNIDYLVLGCSHYPYLIPQIKRILPKNISIIDSGEAVALQTKNILSKNIGFNNGENSSKNIFYTNGNPEILSEILENKYQVDYKLF